MPLKNPAMSGKSKSLRPRALAYETPGQQMVLDPDLHTVHYGKGMSKMYNEYVADSGVRQIINIEARGMTNIRAKFPYKARMIVQAIDMARYYVFNSLHNLVQARRLEKGTRLEGFLKSSLMSPRSIPTCLIR
ncbi:hypothetical protein [Pseudomonas sp. PCH199]|uniref:hypothetical protein n=1 Tax=unclassified Pseudomonas TaxID=196821 RepID=UPI002ADDF3A7|nr:hypothetical protein [Pseudomonas sp. PCH199]